MRDIDVYAGKYIYQLFLLLVREFNIFVKLIENVVSNFKWLLKRKVSVRLAQKLFARLDPLHKGCMLLQMQIAENFANDTIKLFPWFMEYREGRFPTNEALLHSATVKERTNQTCKDLVPAQNAIEPIQSSIGEKTTDEGAESSNLGNPKKNT